MRLSKNKLLGAEPTCWSLGESEPGPSWSTRQCGSCYFSWMGGFCWLGPSGALIFLGGRKRDAPKGECSLWKGERSEARVRIAVCSPFYLVSFRVFLFQQIFPFSASKLSVKEETKQAKC